MNRGNAQRTIVRKLAVWLTFACNHVGGTRRAPETEAERRMVHNGEDLEVNVPHDCGPCQAAAAAAVVPAAMRTPTHRR